MLLGHKIEIRPTPYQIIYLEKSFGARRHCYNQLLDYYQKDDTKWSKYDAQKYYTNVLKKKYKWYNEVSARVTRNSINDLDDAYQKFFKNIKCGRIPGYPKFKKRGSADSFSLREKEKFKVDGRLLRIEKLNTKIKLRQKLRFSGTVKQVTITKRAGKYFASFIVDTPDYNKKNINCNNSVGIDLGIKTLAVLSNGEVFNTTKNIKANIEKLKRLQRKYSKKCDGSNRKAKAKLKVDKLYFRIARQRESLLHKISDYLTANFSTVTVEDLDIAGMASSKKTGVSISNLGLNKLRKQIEYKAALRDCNLVVASRWFPSSKLCSKCGAVKKDLSLADRTYSCECGLRIDRDLNAAINLDKYGRDTLQRDPKRTQELNKTSVSALVLTA